MGEHEAPENPVGTKRIPTEKVQISVYVPTEVAEAARDAVIATTSYSRGYRSLSDLVAEAIAEKLARLERQFNNGRPFPGRSHELHAGRPLG